MKAIEMQGRRFGILTVVNRSDNSKGGKARWLCMCDCGNEKVIYGGSLRSGKTKSCGCIRKEVSKKACTKNNNTRKQKRKVD